MTTARPRRKLNADYIRIETEVDVIVLLDTYNKIGSISQELHGRTNNIVLTDQAMDDLYEALKAREAHKQFLAAKYGDNA
jgi:hypothetical protein